MPAGGPPYAADLYSVIKRGAGKSSLLLSSDQTLSDQGERLWKRLLAVGHKIAVFDTATHQYVLSPNENPDELSKYVGDGNSKYIFVISENELPRISTRHGIEIMELKGVSGYPLSEIFDGI